MRKYNPIYSFNQIFPHIKQQKKKMRLHMPWASISECLSSNHEFVFHFGCEIEIFGCEFWSENIQNISFNYKYTIIICDCLKINVNNRALCLFVFNQFLQKPVWRFNIKQKGYIIETRKINLNFYINGGPNGSGSIKNQKERSEENSFDHVKSNDHHPYSSLSSFSSIKIWRNE